MERVKLQMILMLLMALCVSFSALSFSRAAYGAIWYVSVNGSDSNSGRDWTHPFRTIQKGVDSAGASDQIWITEGTFSLSQEITISKQLEIYGGFSGTETEKEERDLTNKSILDGQNSVRCMLIKSESIESTLDGIHFINGYYEDSDPSGGALGTWSVTLHLYNSVFEGNYATWGGAMDAKYSKLDINNCVFKNNSSKDAGAVYVYRSPSLSTIKNTFFIDNSTNDFGGALRFYHCSGGVENCVFSGNTSNSRAGAIHNDVATTSIMNCSFTNNSASQGGALYNYSSTVYITNSILWSNSPNEIYGGATATYSDIQGGWTGDANIDRDPLFVSNDDLHLMANSPCIDSGTAVDSPATDIQGNPRPHGAGYDMGAYEYQDENTIEIREIVINRSSVSSSFEIPYTGLPLAISGKITYDSQPVINTSFGMEDPVSGQSIVDAFTTDSQGHFFYTTDNQCGSSFTNEAGLYAFVISKDVQHYTTLIIPIIHKEADGPLSTELESAPIGIYNDSDLEQLNSAYFFKTPNSVLDSLSKSVENVANSIYKTTKNFVKSSVECGVDWWSYFSSPTNISTLTFLGATCYTTRITCPVLVTYAQISVLSSEMNVIIDDLYELGWIDENGYMFLKLYLTAYGVFRAVNHFVDTGGNFPLAINLAKITEGNITRVEITEEAIEPNAKAGMANERNSSIADIARLQIVDDQNNIYEFLFIKRPGESTVFVSENDETCGGNTPCYQNIQNAVNAAGQEAIIKITGGVYNQSLLLEAPKSIILQGGWDKLFEKQTSSTVLRQAPKVELGSITMQMLSIRPE